MDKPKAYVRDDWVVWLAFELRKAGFPVETTADADEPGLVVDGVTLSRSRFMVSRHTFRQGYGAWKRTLNAEFKVAPYHGQPVAYKPRQDGTYNIEAIGKRLKIAATSEIEAEKRAAYSRKLRDQEAENRAKIRGLVVPRVAACMGKYEEWIDATNEPGVFSISIKRRVAQEDVKSVLEACRSIHLQSIQGKRQKKEGADT